MLYIGGLIGWLGTVLGTQYIINHAPGGVENYLYLGSNLGWFLSKLTLGFFGDKAPCTVSAMIKSIKLKGSLHSHINWEAFLSYKVSVMKNHLNDLTYQMIAAEGRTFTKLQKSHEYYSTYYKPIINNLENLEKVKEARLPGIPFAQPNFLEKESTEIEQYVQEDVVESINHYNKISNFNFFNKFIKWALIPGISLYLLGRATYDILT